MSAGAYAITGGMPDGADNATLTFRATYGTTTIDRTIFVGKAKTGSQGNPGSAGGVGAPAIVLSVTKPTMMIMAYAEGTPVDPTFLGDDGQLTVMEGVNDVTYACTLSAVGVGCAGSVNTELNVPVAAHAMGYYRVTAMTSDTATLTLNALYKGINFSTVVSLIKAKGGYEIVGSLPVTNLFNGRMVYLTTNGKLYRVVNGAWTAAVAAVDLTGILPDSQMPIPKGQALNDDPYLADPTAWKQWYAPWGAKTYFSTLTGGASGNSFAGATTGTSGNMVGVRPIACNRFKTYRISAYVLVAAGGNGTFYLRPSLMDSNFAELVVGGSTSGIDGVTVPNDGGWHKYSALFTPGAAVYMAAGCILNYTGTVGSMWIQDLRIEEVISGDLILARTIQAGNIAANTLTANEIGTGAITANEIFGGTITGDKMAAGNIITASAQINDGVIISAKIGLLEVNSANIADLTVGTNKITGNAVTNSAHAESGAYTVPDNVIHTINSVTLVATGGTVLIFWDVDIGAAGSTGGCVVWIIRDNNAGIVIDTARWMVPGTVPGYDTRLSGSAVDVPAAGTHSYQVTVMRGYPSTLLSLVASEIIALEVKK